MAPHHIMKRAVYGLVLLAALAAATDADAQRRRMPVRTEPIPDTETGGKAGSGTIEPQNPSMMIYGPPDPILGAPPLPPVPAPVTPAAPAATPPVAAPAPVVTPIPATPAPVAAPVPAPAPAPAPVAIPAPPPAPPPAPIAVPIPAPIPPPAPVAIPIPAPIPPPAPVAAPAPAPAPRAAPVAVPSPPPPPAPVAIPAPAIVPPPVIAPVALPAPAPQPAPVVPRPVIAVPAPAPAPAAPLAAIAPAPSAFTSPKLDAKLVEQIFSCLAPGLPQDWKRTWVVVTSAEAAVATKFLFTATYRDEDAEEFVPCNAQEITRRITGLSESLPPAQRRWKSARLAIDSEGEYELVYEYK